jgi:hypothetical protein
MVLTTFHLTCNDQFLSFTGLYRAIDFYRSSPLEGLSNPLGLYMPFNLPGRAAMSLSSATLRARLHYQSGTTSPQIIHDHPDRSHWAQRDIAAAPNSLTLKKTICCNQGWYHFLKWYNSPPDTVAEGNNKVCLPNTIIHRQKHCPLDDKYCNTKIIRFTSTYSCSGDNNCISKIITADANTTRLHIAVQCNHSKWPVLAKSHDTFHVCYHHHMHKPIPCIEAHSIWNRPSLLALDRLIKFFLDWASLILIKYSLEYEKYLPLLLTACSSTPYKGDVVVWHKRDNPTFSDYSPFYISSLTILHCHHE